jgi:hypothetical protein
MKKIMIYLTIASTLNLIGCSFNKQMNPGEFDFEDSWDMQVTVKDTIYNFESGDYYYKNDSLFAAVSKPLDDKSNLHYTISIPVENIEMVEAQKTDILGTVAIFGAIAFVIYALSTMGDFSP